MLRSPRLRFRRRPFLVVAGDESLRNGDNKFPVIVSYWHVEDDEPLWGLFRVCNMKDKTAETQATLFFEAVVNEIKYPRERVLFVLRDGTASVSSETGGYVDLLRRKLRGEEPTKAKPKAKATAKPKTGGSPKAVRNSTA